MSEGEGDNSSKLKTKFDISPLEGLKALYSDKLHYAQGYYDEGIYVGYRHFNTHNVAPQYPFDYDLSYATFRYGSPTLSASSLTAADSITLSLPVTNTERVKGKEVGETLHRRRAPRGRTSYERTEEFRKSGTCTGRNKDGVVHHKVFRPRLLVHKRPRLHRPPGRFKAYLCASGTDVRATAPFELK